MYSNYEPILSKRNTSEVLWNMSAQGSHTANLACACVKKCLGVLLLGLRGLTGIAHHMLNPHVEKQKAFRAIPNFLTA